MNSSEIRKIIKNNNIQDLRSLLKFLGFPKIEYQVYWLTIIEETREHLYSDDCEYFFSSSLVDGKYKELDNFESDYYEVDLELYQFYHFDKEKNILYYYCFRDEDPVERSKDDLSEEDDYWTYEEITQRFYVSNDSDDEECGTDEMFDTHANDVDNGYGYYDENGKYVSYGPGAI